MKTTRHLLTLFLLMCSISLWAQFPAADSAQDAPREEAGVENDLAKRKIPTGNSWPTMQKQAKPPDRK